MFRHFLVPLDGSQLAETILPVAQTFALTLDATITLLHVVEPDAPTSVHGEPHLVSFASAESYLEGIATQLRAKGLRVEVHVDHATSGLDASARGVPSLPGVRDDVSVVDAIFQHGGELSADLIALTSHGRGGWVQAVYGSIAQRVLQRGTIPVLMLNAEEPTAPQTYLCEKILVPLDSTPIYEEAFEVAVKLARAFRAGLELVVVVPTTETLSPERAATGTFLPTTMRAMLDLAQENATNYLKGKLERLAADGLPVRAQVLRGAIPTQILAVAKQSGAQLIVMATHGRAGLDAFWSGSVAPQVLARARMPVLLLRVKGAEPLR